MKSAVVAILAIAISLGTFKAALTANNLLAGNTVVVPANGRPTQYAVSKGNTTATYNPTTGCVMINSVLAAQVGSITYVDQYDVVTASCQNLLNLASNMQNVIGSTGGTSTVNDANQSGLLGGLLNGVVGGLFNTVGGVLKAVMGLVNGIVGNTVAQACQPQEHVVYTPASNATSSINTVLCFNPGTKVIINVRTGATAQLTDSQATTLTGMMNALAAAAGDVQIQTPVGNYDVNNNVNASYNPN